MKARSGSGFTFQVRWSPPARAFLASVVELPALTATGDSAKMAIDALKAKVQEQTKA